MWSFNRIAIESNIKFQCERKSVHESHLYIACTILFRIKQVCIDCIDQFKLYCKREWNKPFKKKKKNNKKLVRFGWEEYHITNVCSLCVSYRRLLVWHICAFFFVFLVFIIVHSLHFLLWSKLDRRGTKNYASRIEESVLTVYTCQLSLSDDPGECI